MVEGQFCYFLQRLEIHTTVNKTLQASYEFFYMSLYENNINTIRKTAEL